MTENILKNPDHLNLLWAFKKGNKAMEEMLKTNPDLSPRDFYEELQRYLSPDEFAALDAFKEISHNHRMQNLNGRMAKAVRIIEGAPYLKKSDRSNVADYFVVLSTLDGRTAEQSWATDRFWSDISTTMGGGDIASQLIKDLKSILRTPVVSEPVFGRPNLPKQLGILKPNLEMFLKARGLRYDENLWYNPLAKVPLPCEVCPPMTWSSHKDIGYVLCKCKANEIN